MSEQRYIMIPADVNVPVVDGAPVVWSFVKFIADRTADAAFGETLDGIMSAIAIRQACLGPKDGVAALELADWERLCKAIRTPAVGYNPNVMIHLVPHAKAVLDAPSTKP